MNSAYTGGFFGLIGAMIAGFVAWRQSRASTQIAVIKEQTSSVKVEALAKAEIVKAQTDAETKRLDQLLDTSMALIKNLQAENRQQRAEMADNAHTHSEEILQLRNRLNSMDDLMKVCMNERGSFRLEVESNSHEIARLKQEYLALEAHFRNVAEFYKGFGPDVASIKDMAAKVEAAEIKDKGKK